MDAQRSKKQDTSSLTILEKGREAAPPPQRKQDLTCDAHPVPTRHIASALSTDSTVRGRGR
eukprot:2382415-Pleurochrysis_carterae.AAC.1